MTDDGYYLEYQQLGVVVKVTAIDPRTGVEAVIQGPASAGETALGRLAVQKLGYLLRRRHGTSGDSSGSSGAS